MNSKGTTLLETMIALVLVAVAMTGLIVAFVGSGQFGVLSRRQATAMAVARSIAGQLDHAPWTDGHPERQPRQRRRLRGSQCALRPERAAQRRQRSRLHPSRADRRHRDLRGIRERRRRPERPPPRRDRALPRRFEMDARRRPRLPLRPGAGGTGRSRSPYSTRLQSRGYTLVEILVSLAILAVVMAGISGVLDQTYAEASAV